MKRKKYLACCLAMSMMLVSASPMAVSAEAQDDMFYSEDLGVEEAGDSESEEVVEPETADSVDDGFTSEETEEIENFASDVETYEGEGETAGTEDGWTILENETSISFKYDENNKTLSFKCSGTAALPDNKQSGSTAKWALALGNKTKEVETVEIGEGITRIGAFNFNNKLGDYPNLKTVKLASTVTSIGSCAFEKDSNLKEINLDQVECIESSGMAESGIEQAVFKKEQVELDENAFNSCKNLKSVSVKEIVNWGDQTFYGCKSLESFQYEKTVEVLPRHTFNSCAALSKCSITGVKEIGSSAFRSCASLTNFDFSNVVSIGSYAFKGSAITKIAFMNENITLAFGTLDSEYLESVCYPGTKENWDSISSKAKVPSTTAIHCKADTVEAKAATCTEDGWKEVGVCEVCGEHYSYPTEENKLTASGHAWKENYDVDKEPTCTEAGSKSRHCANEGCNETTDVQEIKALGHDYVSKVTKDATCTEKGTLTKTCSRCNDVVTEEIKALGHDFAKAYTVDKKATCTEAGEQSKHCTRKGCDAKDDIQAIPATGHKFSEWKVTTEATVFVAEQQERTCETCGEKETKAVGTALKATVSVNASTVKLKVKQSTSGLKVTGLAKGDSVKTWKSTNTRIFTVKGKANGTCKLTAKKAGTAKLQITLASGLKKTVKVKVQKAAVKTTKVTVAKTKVTVKKGKKVTLKPVVTPFTSKQKVTYTSSNKKVATVSSKGVVTGKKKGTAKITIKSGSKSVKVTVKVK